MLFTLLVAGVAAFTLFALLATLANAVRDERASPPPCLEKQGNDAATSQQELHPVLGGGVDTARAGADVDASGAGASVPERASTGPVAEPMPPLPRRKPAEARREMYVQLMNARLRQEHLERMRHTGGASFAPATRKLVARARPLEHHRLLVSRSRPVPV